MFISFEGPEGCGKSTQLQLLAQTLRSQGREVITVREPGATVLGEGVRHLLLDPGPEPIDPLAELLLFCASRAQLVQQVIRPALAAGAIILADRFLDSTTVYQGLARGLGAQRVEQAHQLTLGDTRPALTLLFDLPVTASFARITQRGHGLDRIEQEHSSFHEAVRQGYLDLAAAEPQRFRILDATAPIEDLAREVFIEVDRALRLGSSVLDPGLKPGP